jgi:hypothetical protein
LAHGAEGQATLVRHALVHGTVVDIVGACDGCCAVFMHLEASTSAVSSAARSCWHAKTMPNCVMNLSGRSERVIMG